MKYLFIGLMLALLGLAVFQPPGSTTQVEHQVKMIVSVADLSVDLPASVGPVFRADQLLLFTDHTVVTSDPDLEVTGHRRYRSVAPVLHTRANSLLSHRTRMARI